MDYIGKEIRRRPLVISGSDSSTFLKVEQKDSGSTAILTNNIQNGYPTSNNWKTNLEGSFFNNFDNTTHVSEILRFMSGVLSHSLDVADAAPNTKTFNSIDTNENSLGSTDSISGRVPNGFASISNSTLNYLNRKGFADIGSTIFSGLSVRHDNGRTYNIDFDSNSGGSTNVSSSNDSELFGLGGLTSGGATQFSVKVIATQSFSDTGSIPNPSSSNTFTTQSSNIFTRSDFGTSNGVTLAKIVTSQPAVIPSAFQDGKFADVGGTNLSGSLSRKYHATKGSFTSVSASGFYNFHGLKVGIATGSSGKFTFKNGTDKNNFFAPVDQIESDLGTNSLSDVATIVRQVSAMSRSLSGAPYLTGSRYELSTKITGLFNPLYGVSTTLTDMTAGSVGVGAVTITGDVLSTNGGTIQTSGIVKNASGNAVNSGVPSFNDVAVLSASVVFEANNGTNVLSSGSSDHTFTVATKARNRNNSQTTLDTQTILYHSASAFGQPGPSGSMFVYGRAQGFDAGSLTGTSEAFSGEDFRIQLTDSVTRFKGTSFVTTFQVGGLLGANDLQVKPGFLVNPSGANRYWYPSGYKGNKTFKYYIRRFRTSGAKSSMTLDVGQTLVNWTATTNNKVAAAILFKSSASGSGDRGGDGPLNKARIYDPSKLTGDSAVSTSIDNQTDFHLNPFTESIDLHSNTGGNLSSTTYTIPLRNADGMFLDDTDNEFLVILRYAGDPTPVSSITTSTS